MLFRSDDGSVTVITAADATFSDITDALKAAGLEAVDAELTMHASVAAPVDGEMAEQVVKLVDHLEDLDDVQDVYTNAEFAD